MARLRKDYKNGFTTVGNDMYRDKELPLKERGLLGTMLSLPDDWNFSIAGLESILEDGESSIRTGLKKLEKLGYLRRNRITDESGKVTDWEYVFSDYRVFEEKPPGDFPQLDNQQLENPDVDNPQLENETQLNTNKLNTNKLIDDVIYKIQNASAIQQLRILEAGYYSKEIQEHLQATNELILRTCQVLSKDKLIKLAKFNDPEKVWKIAYDLTTKEIHASNQDGYFITSINNMLKQGGQE